MSVAGPGAIQRTLRLLSAVADADGPMRVSDAARALDLPVSTTHRLLHQLREEGLVEYRAPDRAYQVGTAFYRIAARALQAVPAPRLSQSHLDRLVAQFGETAIFGLYLPSGPAVAFAARAEGRHVLQYRPAMNVPLSLVRGASGKAILAYLPPEIIEQAHAREPELNDLGVRKPGLAELQEALEAVRSAGYANSVGEKLLGARGLAAPVFGASGVCGCLCITAPADRIGDDDIAKRAAALQGEAAELSWSLGARSTSVAAP